MSLAFLLKISTKSMTSRVEHNKRAIPSNITERETLLTQTQKSQEPKNEGLESEKF